MSKNVCHGTWSDPNSIPILVDCLRDGGVVVGSSDTVVGLLADTTINGYAALNRIKGRSQKPYVVLISDKSKIAHFVSLPLPPAVQKLIDHCWPGPLTLVLPAKDSLPAWVQSATGTIALRVPNHGPLLQVLAQFRGLFSTSANKAGMPVAETMAAIDPDILNAAACTVSDGGAQVSTTPSTIIDCTGPQVRLIRPGAYSVAHLEQLCGVTLQ